MPSFQPARRQQSGSEYRKCRASLLLLEQATCRQTRRSLHFLKQASPPAAACSGTCGRTCKQPTSRTCRRQVGACRHVGIHGLQRGLQKRNILNDYNSLFILWQLGSVLRIITPPPTSSMHRDSRVSIDVN